MKNFVGITFLVVTAAFANVEAVVGASMVSQNVLSRVFYLRIGDRIASGFTIEVAGRQYLITARHFVPASLTELGISRNGNWVSTRFHAISVEPASVDIAVLALERQLSPMLLPISIGYSKNVFLSQEVFFLGFPYGLTINAQALNNGFPIPLVKHGIVAYLPLGQAYEPFLVDGTNNKGFSGGPVITVDSANAVAIVGVISGYLPVREPVFSGTRTPTPTEYSTQANTGFLTAFSIDHALAAIAKNPIGATPTPVPAPGAAPKLP